VTNVQHSAVSAEHYTPKHIVDAIRETLGGIDMDPASCEAANGLVGAEFIYTKEDDGLIQPWAGRLLVNPPGNTKLDRHIKPSYPVQFWNKLVKEWQEGNVESAVYVGFSLEILHRTLEHPCDLHPLDLPTCIFKHRVAFDTWENGERKHSNRPTHGNFVTLVPPLDDPEPVIQRFLQHFVPFGKVVR
jgi:hypothetical protein